MVVGFGKRFENQLRWKTTNKLGLSRRLRVGLRVIVAQWKEEIFIDIGILHWRDGETDFNRGKIVIFLSQLASHDFTLQRSGGQSLVSLLVITPFRTKFEP